MEGTSTQSLSVKTQFASPSVPAIMGGKREGFSGTSIKDRHMDKTKEGRIKGGKWKWLDGGQGDGDNCT